MTLEYLIYTILFLAGGSMALKLFFTMIQTGNALDVVFKWQKMLAWLYGGNKFMQLAGKALGDCAQCTAFWFMPWWFFLYWKFSYLLFDYYPTQGIDSWFWKIAFHAAWYVVIHAIGATLGFAVLMYKSKKERK